MSRNPLNRHRFWLARRQASAILVSGDAATPAMQTPALPEQVVMPHPANLMPTLPPPEPVPAPEVVTAIKASPVPRFGGEPVAIGTMRANTAGTAAAPSAAKAAGRAGKRGKAAAAGPLDASDRHGRGLPNLTDLADRYGSDKGSAKHRYTELYNMLLQPYRTAPVNFLEMGLQIGGPELGHSQDRATTDLPSVRMWLDFFTNAQIWGLDISDFSWFSHDRFSFVRCDMDTRANIAAVAQGMPPMNIIIDDASHASHHQQFGFLELFPRLNDGGLYIIEDLRWQPAPYEKPGITKTADLFQSYVQTGVFQHSDPAVAQAFNALRLDMSGCFLHQVHFTKSRRDQVLVVHKR